MSSPSYHTTTYRLVVQAHVEDMLGESKPHEMVEAAMAC